ncbi:MULTISPECIES: YkvA family protein [Mesonia]|uniref:YkvA family protein n=1 Tax=Mesonia TaxID=232115 RepID=UPI0024B99701|nr:YkvA family protein [Mesonia mobilis]|tara:strand:- start:318 stop:716 length:399 start_codon:yes stop_codon:yes gene_type:complete
MIFDKVKDKINEEYVRQEAKKTRHEDITETLDNQEEIDKKMSTAGVLKKYTELGKLMVNMLKDYKVGIYKDVPWFTIASVVFALLYVLNPLDIIPDFIPGFGYVDDASVLALALRFIESDLHKYLDWKLEQD